MQRVFARDEAFAEQFAHRTRAFGFHEVLLMRYDTSLIAAGSFRK